MQYKVNSQTVCLPSQNTDQMDDFQKVGVLVTQLLSEKSSEFSELKKENTELKERISRLEEVLLVPYAEESDIKVGELKNKVIDYISERKSRGNQTISDFEIMEHFNISIEKVDEVLALIEKDGLIGKRVDNL